MTHEPYRKDGYFVSVELRSPEGGWVNVNREDSRCPDCPDELACRWFSTKAEGWPIIWARVQGYEFWQWRRSLGDCVAWAIKKCQQHNQDTTTYNAQMEAINQAIKETLA